MITSPSPLLKLRALIRSDFGNKALWFTALSIIERLIAVFQTVLIARSLGITQYGVYGLLFGTIGLVASVVGLQMGLTATVFVSRYRETEKQKAAAVIGIVRNFGWVVALVFIFIAVPFSYELSSLLLKSDQYQLAIIFGIAFVAISIVSGIQDGVAQGFEIFGALARVKIASTTLTLGAIYPAAYSYGLNGVLSAILIGAIAKLVLLNIAVKNSIARSGIPDKGSGVSFRMLVTSFALPSMIISLLAGSITWAGMFLLSRQQVGFDGVAIVNTGLQWRGPILLLAASLGGVAIPAFSRFSANGDAVSSRELRRLLSFANLLIAMIVAIVLIAGSGIIMSTYGPEFIDGRLAFAMILLSSVPTVVGNVYMQQLVGSARMWRQVWIQLPFLVVMGVAFLLMVPRYGANGYALSLFVGSVIFLISVLLVDRHKSFES